MTASPSDERPVHAHTCKLPYKDGHKMCQCECGAVVGRHGNDWQLPVSAAPQGPTIQTLTEWQIAQRLTNRAARLLKFHELPQTPEVIIEKERELIDQAVELWRSLRGKTKPTGLPQGVPND